MLREYLENMAAAWTAHGRTPPLETFVLRNGVERQGNTRPKGVRRSTPKMCFRNAALLALNKGDAYYEGYAITARLPLAIHHAWVMRGDVLIDNTWEDPAAAFYMGVPFTTDVLRRTILKTRHWGLLDTGLGLNIDLMCELDGGFAEAIGYHPTKRGTP